MEKVEDETIGNIRKNAELNGGTTTVSEMREKFAKRSLPASLIGNSMPKVY